jgi:hypothetical protein
MVAESLSIGEHIPAGMRHAVARSLARRTFSSFEMVLQHVAV